MAVEVKRSGSAVARNAEHIGQAKSYRAPTLVKGPVLARITADSEVSGLTQDGS